MRAEPGGRGRVGALTPSTPAFALFRPWLDALAPCSAVPGIDRLNEWARAADLALPGGLPLRFVAAERTRESAIDYERRVAATGAIGTRRGSLHDFCNALAWLAFPRTKAALNARHVAAGSACTPNLRDPARDAATLLDESGLLFVCGNPDVVAGLRAHRWRQTFWEARPVIERDVCAVVIGHGLLAKLVAPYRAITAKALVVPPDDSAAHAGDTPASRIDTLAARLVAGGDFTPASLAPLPVAALPGWNDESLGAQLFDDSSVFRPARDRAMKV